jgi:transcriptional regulator with XRE-family HTH domain
MQNRIKHWRVVRGMSQHELAEKVELSQSTISRLETGEIRLTLDMMEKCAVALNVSLSQIYSNDTNVEAEGTFAESTHA